MVPLFWTLPRIVELQATIPAAVCEGTRPFLLESNSLIWQ